MSESPYTVIMLSKSIFFGPLSVTRCGRTAMISILQRDCEAQGEVTCSRLSASRTVECGFQPGLLTSELVLLTLHSG